MPSIASAPTATDAEHRFRAAMALHQRGDIAAAIASLRACLGEHPRYLRAHTTLATLLAQQGRFADAEAAARAGLSIAPEAGAVHHLLAKTLHRQGRLGDAAVSYRAACSHGLDTPELLIEFASLLVDLAQLDEAEAMLQKALATAPNQPKALVLLGRVAELRGDLDGAIAFHDRALAEHPGHVNAYVTRGAARRWRGDIAGALQDFEQALTLSPELPAAIANRGMTLLSMGRLTEGWRDYRSRVRARDGEPDLSADRPWDGTPLDGKRVLVWTEYGLGDEIMAASLLPDLIDRTAHCTLVCSARLAPLMRRSFGSVDVVAMGSGISGDFDARLPLMDAAAWLRPTIESFPQRHQYLAADAARAAALRRKYGGGTQRLVGISWRSTSVGTGPFKSTRLADWTIPLAIKGVQFVSLQYGADVRQAEAAKASLGADIVIDPTVDPVGDVDGLAAQVEAMDLVITVSNTTAHIAGALGKPTWLLAPEGLGAHWYWFKDRADNPWYPSLRLFRQSRAGAWAEPLAAVGQALEAWARS